MHRMKILQALAFVLFASAGPDTWAENEIDPASGLTIDSGWQLVRAHCGGCHSHKLVTGQRADRQTWLSIIRWMQETQNLWQFDETTENSILDYLARNYPPQPNRRRAPIPPDLLPRTGTEAGAGR